jgi:hypothetical protein
LADKKIVYNVLIGKCEREDHFRDLSMEWRMELRWTLKVEDIAR